MKKVNDTAVEMKGGKQKGTLWFVSDYLESKWKTARPRFQSLTALN